MTLYHAMSCLLPFLFSEAAARRRAVACSSPRGCSQTYVSAASPCMVALWLDSSLRRDSAAISPGTVPGMHDSTCRVLPRRGPSQHLLLRQLRTRSQTCCQSYLGLFSRSMQIACSILSASPVSSQSPLREEISRACSTCDHHSRCCGSLPPVLRPVYRLAAFLAPRKHGPVERIKFRIRMSVIHRSQSFLSVERRYSECSLHVPISSCTHRDIHVRWSEARKGGSCLLHRR
ncbi:hypothetical protein K466DRAFT_208985 [Polyporus arcularius HHB13444]|uniref:Secreted protein n=1 Tax=Polyporus arcularius HHB13444 TaxID=1314778 RepID=A0A5C3P7I8_9APHY|nr:hypothetical protein K466DRAFT_208985 [Polyporus arcularius HHB13444]